MMVTDDKLDPDAQRILESRLGSLLIATPTADAEDALAP